MRKFPKILLGLLTILIVFSALGLSSVFSKTYQALSKTDTAGIFRIIRTSLQEDLMMSFSRDVDSSQEGAVGMTAYAVGQRVIRFYFRDIPEQVSKKVAIETIKLGYHLLNSPNTAYTLIDTLEKVSVAKANQVALAWLTQNDIKAAGGDIDIQYTSYQGKEESHHLQYILLYHPLSNHTARVITTFYSPDSLVPIDSRGYIPWPFHRWLAKGNQRLEPFILKIEGKVEKNYASYNWTNDPQIDVNFPDFVPQFSFQTDHLDLWHPFSWLKKRWSTLIAPRSEIVITPQTSSPAPDLEDLKETVQSLKEVVDQQLKKPTQEPQEVHPSELLGVFKELTQTIAQQNQENNKAWDQIRQIAQSQAEIAKMQVPQNSTLALTSQNIESTTPDKTAVSNLCSTDNLDQPNWNQVIFNEIDWMGNQDSPNNEWLELKNVSTQIIDLNNWQIFNRNKHLVIRFNDQDKIQPNQLFLLERTDDQSVPNRSADKIYQGGLKNSNETLYLFDNHCQLQDIVEASPDWPAGDSSSRRTMERKTNFDWQTSYAIGGTPKLKNSQGYQDPTITTPTTTPVANPRPQPAPSQPSDTYPPVAQAGPDQTVEFGQPITIDASQSGDNVGIVSYKWDTTDDGLWNIVKTDPILTLDSGSFPPGEYTITLEVVDAANNTDEDQVHLTILDIPKILINEIQTAGQNSQDEFVELFNPNDRDVNLTNWSLKKKTASGHEATLVSNQDFQGIIPAQGYFLITPSINDQDHGYRGAISADLYYSNQSNSLADNNSLLLYNPAGEISDKIGFGSDVTDYENTAYPDNPQPNYSLGRKWDSDQQLSIDNDNNATDFEIDKPTPKALNEAYQKPIFTNINFTLSDEQSGSLSVTTQSAIQVNIENDQDATAWILSEEQKTEPTADDPQWLTEKPTEFNLSQTDGTKSVYLWMKNDQGVISPQYQASIVLDENPPQAIFDLQLYPTKQNGEILLTWTSPGQADDSAATKYFIKESDQPITEDTWEEATLVEQNLVPQAPGQSESFLASDLDPAQTYYFALKSQDKWEVASPISNSPSRRAIGAQGTPEDPYIITSCQDLQDIQENLNASYQLAHSLDCAGTIDWNNGQGFNPLGDNITPFTGSLDGQGFTIDNLHINRTDQTDGWDVGFIGKAKAGAQINHLGLRNADIKGYKYVGGLIGFAQGFIKTQPIQVDNCYTTGHLASSENKGEEGYVGGLIGFAQKTVVNQSWSSMEIDASQTKIVGGLIGEMNLQSQVKNSFSQGKIKGLQVVGGLIGDMRSGTSAEQCWTTGEVTGDQAGGFVGIIEGSIKNSYAQTKVIVTGQTGGGFAALSQGSSSEPASLINCYASGYVYGVQNNIQRAGFLNKLQHAQETSCYWDVNTSGQELTGGKAVGFTTKQMQKAENFSDWDFDKVWQIQDSQYPTLRE